ncbi:MAG: acetate--CoA ligase family protein, partial [Conexivisphaera sp.]
MAASLECFLNPRSIAVVGPSPRGNIGTAVLGNLLEMRSRGVLRSEVHAVNPKYDSCLGVPCEPDLPRAELAVIAVPPQLTLDYLRRAASLGYAAAIVISGGFEEAGGPSLRELLPELRGMRVLGPNTLGVVDTYTGMFAIFLPRSKGGAENLPEPRAGDVVLIAQSGGLSASLYDGLISSGPGLRALISVGNAVDVGIHEWVDFFASDGRTSVILMYLERTSEGRALLDAVKRARDSGKRVIALLGGVTPSGRRATSSHTASILSSARVAGEALRQAGAYVARDLEDALDSAKAASMVRSDPGASVAVLTNSGGAGVLATDALSSLGFDLPDLSSSPTLRDLRSSGALSQLSSIANPVDVTGSASNEEFIAAYGALMREPSVGGVLLIPTHYPPGITEELPLRISSLRAKPTVVVEVGDSELSRRTRALYDSLGMPSYPSPERAARALHAVRWFNVNRGTWTPGRIPRGGLELRGELWPDLVGALSSLGFDLPEWSWVESPEDWPADRYPAVLKVHSRYLAHKTEAGAVVVGIRDPREMAEALRRLSPLARSTSGRLYAQRMVSGVEVRLGVVRDADFGCVVDVGLGGVFTELVGDHSTRVAPVTDEEALSMLSELRLRPLLEGYRGAPRADLHRLSAAISRFSDAACSAGIEEFEINPLIVSGASLYAVDARASLSSGARDTGQIRPPPHRRQRG